MVCGLISYGLLTIFNARFEYLDGKCLSWTNNLVLFQKNKKKKKSLCVVCFILTVLNECAEIKKKILLLIASLYRTYSWCFDFFLSDNFPLDL